MPRKEKKTSAMGEVRKFTIYYLFGEQHNLQSESGVLEYFQNLFSK